MTKLRLLAVTLAFAGVTALAVAAYQLAWTTRSTTRAQHALQHEFDRHLVRDHARGASTAIRPVEPAKGRSVAVIRIPRLGADWRFVVVQGSDGAQLADGPGHIPGSAMPGQVGNVGIAGHRVTHAHPFYDLDRLRPGDRIFLRTAYGRFTYTVVGSRIVRPTEVSVLESTPGMRLLTLTTCNPRFSARERLVVRAMIPT